MTLRRPVTPAARARRRIRTPVLIFATSAWIATIVADPMVWAWHTNATAMNMSMASSADPSMMNNMSMRGSASAGTSFGFLSMWLLMLSAMMSPLLIGPLRHLSQRSLSRRRGRATLLFLTPYVAIWALGGFALEMTSDVLSRLSLPIVVVFAVAIVWQLSPARKRCLNRHHAWPSLAAFGGDADRDAVRFGASQALWCFGSCWSLMLLPLVIATGSVALMAFVSLLIWAEQLEKPRRPAWGLRLPLTAVRLGNAAISRLSRPLRTPQLARR